MALPLLPLAGVAGLGALAESLGRYATGSGSGNFLTGYPGETKQFSRFTPQQQGLQNQALNQALSYLQSGGRGNVQSGAFSGLNFAPIAEQARSNFSQRTIPSLSERFAGTNSTRSSAFNSAIGSAASDLESNLAALQSKYNLASQGQQNQLLNILLALASQPQYETAYSPSQPGLLHGIAPGVGDILGSRFASYLGGMGGVL